ncbi:MAG: CatB-related O-acetyltransferase [Veillonella sp.]|jgi:chloramphenicol O-acetyltransferase|uniref:CatB-related O-acetyltransferase n=1 Tax=Veillonella sp. TaxID=1926307 RepID=UPI002903AA04|nr:CatB-related O-acetyltransferase [Veillonella sp.]MDU1409891.1 CatB-related O-acetyltransferase [Veillonella sp.]MDU1939376.1 CatB-related O-acetyltransferase [Veillonella sp.]MDU5865829.1 CatB-related O-acetyltransferase [Veillonella sp.]
MGKLYLEGIRKIRGTSNPPEWLYKYSKKKYGWKDNLSRYWFDKYIGIPIGKFTYGYRSYQEREMHSIGSFCSIGIDQHLVQNGHNINYVSTYGNFLDYKKDMPNADRSIRICNDVWIGAHSIIRSGVTIGDGSVIGAGSVITKDVEPYTVVVGSNRVIKQRFSDSIVESLLSMKWWKWDDDKILKV